MDKGLCGRDALARRGVKGSVPAPRGRAWLRLSMSSRAFSTGTASTRPPPVCLGRAAPRAARQSARSRSPWGSWCWASSSSSPARRSRRPTPQEVRRGSVQADVAHLGAGIEMARGEGHAPLACLRAGLHRPQPHTRATPLAGCTAQASRCSSLAAWPCCLGHTTPSSPGRRGEGAWSNPCTVTMPSAGATLAHVPLPVQESGLLAGHDSRHLMRRLGTWCGSSKAAAGGRGVAARQAHDGST